MHWVDRRPSLGDGSWQTGMPFASANVLDDLIHTLR